MKQSVDNSTQVEKSRVLYNLNPRNVVIGTTTEAICPNRQLSNIICTPLKMVK
jgi:hypothetical protein